MEYFINVHRHLGDKPHAIAFRTRQGVLEALAEQWMEGGCWNYEHTLHVLPPGRGYMVKILDLSDDTRRLADEWRDELKEPARLKAWHEGRQL